ncbi:hypothetical protein HAX54_032178, partial [Datura stramonium]|nr:hypothetical protein [Datura stramonium]
GAASFSELETIEGGLDTGRGELQRREKKHSSTKRHATQEWFESQYADPSCIQNVGVTNPFTIDWHNLTLNGKTLYGNEIFSQ